MKTTLAVLLTLYLPLSGCFGPPDVQTDPRKYAATLELWKSTDLIDHFPKAIPASAQNVYFSTFPGFLQGGGWLQLRLELPADEIRELHKYATSRALQYHDGGGQFTLANKRRDDGLASTFFHTSDNHSEGHLGVEFPEDYRIFIFFAEASPEAGSTWDKGRSKGIAISLERSEVVYWANRW